MNGDGEAAGGLHTIELAGGRRLAWRSFGAAEGPVVIALHGTPGSSLKFAPAAGDAARLGLRLIAVDRWGYGGSDRHPRATLPAFADDMRALLDALGVERAAVFGISGGGPYAVATAVGLGKRGAALALVAPVGPIAGFMTLADMGLFHWLSFRVLPRVPGGVAGVFTAFRALANASPRLALRVAAGRAGAHDRAIVTDPVVYGALGRAFQDGLRRGVAGPVIDMDVFGAPWGIDPGDVRIPSRLWLGTKDRNVPIKAAERLIGMLPGGELAVVDGAGHFWISKNHSEVLGWIAGNVQPAGSRA